MSDPTPPTPPASETPGTGATLTPTPAPVPATVPAAAGPGVGPGKPPFPRGPGGPGGPGRGGPPNPGGPRPGGASRPFPQGNRPPRDKPLNTGGGVPQLNSFGGHKPNNRELDAEIEAEMAQAMTGFKVESTVAEEEKVRRPQGAPGTTPRQRKKGRIIGIHGKDVFVEVPGGRSQGMLPLMQFEGRIPLVGEEVEFEIERYDAADGILLLTRDGSVQVITDWSKVQLHSVIEVKVTGTNKSKTGLTIEVAGIKGFLPASQLDLYRVENLEQFVNQRLKVQVVELEPEERNLIVSRRALLERERAVKAEQFWLTIKEGETRKGIIKSVKPFGAFVDLGGVDGLIPISEFSWQRVNDLNTLVKIGESVQVLVVRVDHEARKIALSIKALSTSPWDEFATRVKSGARVKGTVTRVADFGAFVELEPGVEGLIHISELSTQRVQRVRDIVSEGQTVEVEILNVDPVARRIGLSLKRIALQAEVAGDAAEEAAEEAERLADETAANETMATRPANPNLRGGIGGNATKFESE